VNRETSTLATLSVLLVLAGSVFAQEPQIQPSPALPANVLGPQLIVWSELQKPRPVPQPLPPPDRPEQVPDQPQAQPAQPANAQAQQQPAAQTFTGTIVKDGAKYILKESSGTTYQLDDQDNAKQYEGKQVKILGNLDANTHTLHVVSIQVIS
jgi:hypothetical protein